MNQIEIFNSPEFGSIRTLEQNGKVLFCGTDVATALGYTNPRKAVRDHTRGGTKCSIGVQTGKKADGSPAVQMVEMLFIPEGDLYRLIAHSKLPSAERFEQWVFDEVLPAIRKHGAYLTKEKLWEIATSPEALIKLCSELLAEREENASLREENALLESKAAFYDLFIDLNHSTNLRTTFRLKGKGIPELNGRGRGDQYVTVYIETPRNLNREQKEALKKFAESVGDNNYEERKKFFKKFKK